MKTIPKLLDGGFMSLFTQYTPILSAAPSPYTRGYRSRERTRDSEREESTTGKLTEKDLFELISKVDGLPNDTKALVSKLQDLFLVTLLNGSADISNLASIYTSILYDIKKTNFDRKEYDKAYTEVTKNGGLNELAITTSGQVVVLDENNNLSRVDVEDFLSGNYRPLTNSNLLYLRAYQPEYVNNNYILDTVTNGIGMELVDKLIREKVSSLGTNIDMRTGYSIKSDSSIAQGLDVLSQAEEGMTLDGMYKNKIITKNQKQQAEAALQYIYNTLPDNAKTLLSIKSGNASNPRYGAQNIIFLLITSKMSLTDSSDDNYESSNSKSSSSSKSSGRSGEDPKFGYWAQVVSGLGGNDTSYNILMDTGSANIPVKYYGSTPGPDLNCSLLEYLNKSGVGYISSDNSNISFGNITLSTDSFNDIMVNRAAGAYTAIIPIKNGKPWLEIAEVYSNFKKDLRLSGLKEGSEQYNLKVTELLRNPEYSALSQFVLSNGELNPSNSGLFFVLEGVTSNKASGISNNKAVSLDNFDSKYIIDVSDNSGMYDELLSGLSNEKDGKYDLDSAGLTNAWGLFGYNKIYKGNIFIPLNNNLNNAANADNTDIKESTSYRYEEASLTWQKTNSFAGSGSDVLQPKLGII